MGAEHPEVSAIVGNLAIASAMRGDVAGAIPLWRRIVSSYQATADPDVWVFQYNIGLAEISLGRWTAAEADLTDALAAAARAAPGDTKPVATCTATLGEVLHLRGDLDGAERILDRAIQIAIAADVNQVTPMTRRARVAIDRRDLAAARALLERAGKELAPADAGSPPSPPGSALTLALGKLAHASDGCSAALPQYDAAVASSRDEQNQVVMGEATIAAALCQLEVGKADAAIAPLEALIAQLDQAAADPLALAAPRFALARALVMTGGDRARARAMAEAARVAYATAPGGAAEGAAVAKWLTRIR
jgi:tetratricopeptide (TPR) repeat protein